MSLGREQSGSLFQHTAARRRLRNWSAKSLTAALFQHTAARRRLLIGGVRCGGWRGFNTQPPEGGCTAAARGKWNAS